MPTQDHTYTLSRYHCRQPCCNTGHGGCICPAHLSSLMSQVWMVDGLAGCTLCVDSMILTPSAHPVKQSHVPVERMHLPLPPHSVSGSPTAPTGAGHSLMAPGQSCMVQQTLRQTLGCKPQHCCASRKFLAEDNHSHVPVTGKQASGLARAALQPCPTCAHGVSASCSTSPSELSSCLSPTSHTPLPHTPSRCTSITRSSWALV
jgi:hypothetical protein